MKVVICKDAFGKPYRVSVEELGFRVGVYAVIIQDSKILLTRQWGGYSLIGGTVEIGETLEKALMREVKEETGLTVTPNKLFFHATTFFKRNQEAKPRQSVQLYFSHSKISGIIKNHDLTKSEEGYTDDTPEWVSLDFVNKIKFRHSVPIATLLKAYKATQSNRANCRPEEF
jgi:ADP-ribose pyrophosphatase YjhB (NUDIX family)